MTRTNREVVISFLYLMLLHSGQENTGIGVDFKQNGEKGTLGAGARSSSLGLLLPLRSGPAGAPAHVRKDTVQPFFFRLQKATLGTGLPCGGARSSANSAPPLSTDSAIAPSARMITSARRWGLKQRTNMGHPAHSHTSAGLCNTSVGAEAPQKL